MALDGIFLRKVRNELLREAKGLRVDRVNQPAKDEIILNLRGRSYNKKLLICLRADSSRIHFTRHNIENPPVPPMFCMLLRKHLQGAVIKDVRQLETDRVLFIDFDGTNEIGDKTELTLCVEIMGKYSNLILLQGDRILDSIKRVDYSTSSVRQILPGLTYFPVPSQNKLSIERHTAEELLQGILSHREKSLSSAIISTVQGVSPIISREIAYKTCFGDVLVGELNDALKAELSNQLNALHSGLDDDTAVYMLIDKNSKPKDISHLDIRQYSDSMSVKKYESCSELLDDFFYERDRINRINHRGHELIKLVGNLIERTSRKISAQRAELEQCADKDKLRLYGELIVANAYKLKKGVSFYEVENYYDDCRIIRIPCNPALSAQENQKKYYKEYRKAQTAEKMLVGLIEDGINELGYLESVLDELSRADTDSEISLIRAELYQGGYIRNTKNRKQKPPKELPPIEFRSDDGFRILVGRNNIQNDKLSLKQSMKNDMWLHTQKIPGSHVIICAGANEISDLAIEQAAVIAACYSKAKESSLVPVDYTRVRQLKKPNGAKAGMVIYHEYWTIIVKPDSALAERLKVK